MGVHNGAPWVREAVMSVLTQTAPDLELIVIDDASDDATPDLLAAVSDLRLRVERPRNREGLTRALNRALGMARAPLVARLDADDMALPERFARQRAVFDAQPAIGLLGTGAQEVDASGFAVAVLRPPADDAGIRRALIRRNPFVHSSVMARRSIVEQAGGYDPRFPVAQDYDLWMRVSPLSRLGNVPEPLVIRRLIPGRISEGRGDHRLPAAARIRWRAGRPGAQPARSARHAPRPPLLLAPPPSG